MVWREREGKKSTETSALSLMVSTECISNNVLHAPCVSVNVFVLQCVGVFVRKFILCTDDCQSQETQ